MYYIFYSTNNVFKGEEILNDNNIDYKVVPTPVKDNVYCGVCLWSDEDVDVIKGLFDLDKVGQDSLNDKYIILG